MRSSPAERWRAGHFYPTCYGLPSGSTVQAATAPRRIGVMSWLSTSMWRWQVAFGSMSPEPMLSYPILRMTSVGKRVFRTSLGARHSTSSTSRAQVTGGVDLNQSEAERLGMRLAPSQRQYRSGGPSRLTARSRKAVELLAGKEHMPPCVITVCTTSRPVRPGWAISW